jgi:hypothetical protein
MQLSPRQPRTPFELSDSLKHQLNMYRLAASSSVPRQLGMYAVVVGAAGMGLLALPELADAKIVYTKTHRIIGPGSTCRLIFRDAPDFSLWNNESDNGRTYSILAVAPLRRGNGAIGNASYASALHQGSRIGTSRDFLSGTARLVRGGVVDRTLVWPVGQRKEPLPRT